MSYVMSYGIGWRSWSVNQQYNMRTNELHAIKDSLKTLLTKTVILQWTQIKFRTETGNCDPKDTRLWQRYHEFLHLRTQNSSAINYVGGCSLQSTAHINYNERMRVCGMCGVWGVDDPIPGFLQWYRLRAQTETPGPILAIIHTANGIFEHSQEWRWNYVFCLQNNETTSMTRHILSDEINFFHNLSLCLHIDGVMKLSGENPPIGYFYSYLRCWGKACCTTGD